MKTIHNRNGQKYTSEPVDIECDSQLRSPKLSQLAKSDWFCLKQDLMLLEEVYWLGGSPWEQICRITEAVDLFLSWLRMKDCMHWEYSFIPNRYPSPTHTLSVRIWNLRIVLTVKSWICLARKTNLIWNRKKERRMWSCGCFNSAKNHFLTGFI